MREQTLIAMLANDAFVRWHHGSNASCRWPLVVAGHSTTAAVIREQRKCVVYRGHAPYTVGARQSFRVSYFWCLVTSLRFSLLVNNRHSITQSCARVLIKEQLDTWHFMNGLKQQLPHNLTFLEQACCLRSETNISYTTITHTHKKDALQHCLMVAWWQTLPWWLLVALGVKNTVVSSAASI